MTRDLAHEHWADLETARRLDAALLDIRFVEATLPLLDVCIEEGCHAPRCQGTGYCEPHLLNARITASRADQAEQDRLQCAFDRRHARQLALIEAAPDVATEDGQ